MIPLLVDIHWLAAHRGDTNLRLFDLYGRVRATALAAMGREDVTVYDDSMAGWSADASLPVVYGVEYD